MSALGSALVRSGGSTSRAIPYTGFSPLRPTARSRPHAATSADRSRCRPLVQRRIHRRHPPTHRVVADRHLRRRHPRIVPSGALRCNRPDRHAGHARRLRARLAEHVWRGSWAPEACRPDIRYASNSRARHHKLYAWHLRTTRFRGQRSTMTVSCRPSLRSWVCRSSWWGLKTNAPLRMRRFGQLSFG